MEYLRREDPEGWARAEAEVEALGKPRQVQNDCASRIDLSVRPPNPVTSQVGGSSLVEGSSASPEASSGSPEGLRAMKNHRQWESIRAAIRDFNSRFEISVPANELVVQLLDGLPEEDKAFLREYQKEELELTKRNIILMHPTVLPAGWDGRGRA